MVEGAAAGKTAAGHGSGPHRVSQCLKGKEAVGKYELTESFTLFGGIRQCLSVRRGFLSVCIRSQLPPQGIHQTAEGRGLIRLLAVGRDAALD